MMVWKVAINLTIKRNYSTAERRKQIRRDEARNTIAAVKHDLERTMQADRGGNRIDIRLLDIETEPGALTCTEGVRHDPVIQMRDLIIRECLTFHHNLDAIVFARIVAACEHHSRIGYQGMRSEI